MKRVAVVVSPGHVSRKQTLLNLVTQAIRKLVGENWRDTYEVAAYQSPLSTLGQLESLALIILYASELPEHQDALNTLEQYAREERLHFEKAFVPFETEGEDEGKVREVVERAVRAGLHLDMESDS